MFFWEENNFSKKNLNFFGETVFVFGKNILRTTTGENLRKILRAVLEICDRLQINFFVSKFKIFFSKSPNGSIRKVRWFLAIFIFFAFTLVHQASRLSHFSTNFENEVLVDFIDFGWLDMLDIAYSSSTYCSRSLENQELPDLRAKWCKMRPIMQKKCENLDFRLFFRVWVLGYAW